jgi:hypothetical protein
MVRPKLGDRRLLPIELPRENVDLVATGQGELRDMLLKQPLVRIRPARCGPAVLPALRPLGVGQPLGACRDWRSMTARWRCVSACAASCA